MTSLRFDEQTKIYVSQDSGTLFTIDFPIQNYQPLREFWTHLALDERNLGARAWRKFFQWSVRWKSDNLWHFLPTVRDFVCQTSETFWVFSVFGYNRNRCSWSYRFPNICCASAWAQQLQSGSVPYTSIPPMLRNHQKPSHGLFLRWDFPLSMYTIIIYIHDYRWFLDVWLWCMYRYCIHTSTNYIRPSSVVQRLVAVSGVTDLFSATPVELRFSSRGPWPCETHVRFSLC